MAAPSSKLEIANILLLKFIEAQASVSSLDATKTSEEWPATAGATITARGISNRLADIRKDAIQRGLVKDSFSMPCSNYRGAKGTSRQQRTRSSKKRAREEEDDDDEIVVDSGSDNNEKTALAAPTSNNKYLSPPSTTRTKSRPTFLATATGSSADLKGFRTPDRTTCEVEVNYDETDSDSDSLADFGDTLSKVPKRKRMLPARLTRGGRNYYGDGELDAGGPDESDDEFDPFKVRKEEEKKEARRNRMRGYTKDIDDCD